MTAGTKVSKTACRVCFLGITSLHICRYTERLPKMRTFLLKESSLNLCWRFGNLKYVWVFFQIIHILMTIRGVFRTCQRSMMEPFCENSGVYLLTFVAAQGYFQALLYVRHTTMKTQSLIELWNSIFLRLGFITIVGEWKLNTPNIICFYNIEYVRGSNTSYFSLIW